LVFAWTASLIAALDVATGKVAAADVERNDSAHFIEFLEQITHAQQTVQAENRATRAAGWPYVTDS